MKKLYILLLFVLILSFLGCKSKLINIPSHYYAKVFISVDKSVEREKPLKVYLNQSDLNRSLSNKTPNIIYLYRAKNSIQIVQKYKTADMSFEVQKGSTLYFKLLKTPQNNLIIVQMQKK